MPAIMPLRQMPRIVGFEVPPLKAVVDVVRDAPIVGLLSRPPSDLWLDAFAVEAARLRTSLTDALVSIEDDHVLFFASASNARARCHAVRTMVLEVSKRAITGPNTRRPDAPVLAVTPQAGRRRVLVVEADEVLREVTSELLAGAAWQVTGVTGGDAAARALEAGAIDVVLADIDLMEDGHGLELAGFVRQRWPQTGIVVLTGRHETAKLKMPEGTFVLAKPHQRRQLLAALDLASGPSTS
ncbi:response regulator [Luteibacter aegosomaticola]|uniref:response regulator n=1 Tax=Luteibacter aegosomaticola TaxID=2911538 RepID=UPI001FFA49A7|nr:response regulator [Luteibacter aegosomaticola]UPG88235.1 response regulator [Luteibacter aegosomaticola]